VISHYGFNCKEAKVEDGRRLSESIRKILKKVKVILNIYLIIYIYNQIYILKYSCISL